MHCAWLVSPFFSFFFVLLLLLLLLLPWRLRHAMPRRGNRRETVGPRQFEKSKRMVFEEVVYHVDLITFSIGTKKGKKRSGADKNIVQVQRAVKRVEIFN